ncbi:uncharacterized protein PSMG1 [Battus philenor]|uniref:uncharacterized protein PSMG1 n=1 Tax=Battus philenor TaxID=42288 RepID=UPI0035CFE27F
MTFFGEIVEPVSRTIWEDWDDAIPNCEYSKLQWECPTEINKEIDTFFIIDGKHLVHFIDLQSQLLELINEIKEIGLKLFEIKTLNKYLCVVKDYNIVLSSEIVELLQPYLETCRNVITIQTNPMSEYRSTQVQIQPCLVRGIYTSAELVSSRYEFPRLEQPNILSGVAAGVITLREQLNLKGIALLCYIEYTEYYQVEELQKLLNSLDIGPIFQSSTSSVLSSNLYI